MTQLQPQLSVVLLVDRQRRRGAACLASLLAQANVDALEVLLLDFALGHEPPLPGSDHPSVRVLSGPSNLGLGTARTLAVDQARAPIVAFVEEHCAVMADWAAAVLSAHERYQADGVGAEIHNYNPEFPVSRIVELINYPAWLPPAQPGPTELMAGHNSSYRRDVLLRYRSQLPALLGSEVLLQWKLAADGCTLVIDPTVKLRHANETELANICRGYFLWNRCFTPLRAETFHWTFATRALRILSTPLLPFVRWAKLLLYLSRVRPERLRDALLNAPAILWIQAHAAAGQAAGLLFGLGDADVRFLQYECNAPRRIPAVDEQAAP